MRNNNCNMNSEIIETLRKYKQMTRNTDNHALLIKDKTVILCTAAFFDNEDITIVSLCLDIIEDFIQNYDCHQALLSTFGIFEALESLSIRLRTSNNTQANRATVMVDTLRKSAPPAYSTRFRTKGKHVKKIATMHQLYIPNLTIDNRPGLEECLVHIRGLVSFVLDLEQQKCTIRITPKASIDTIIRFIENKCNLKALIVTRNPADVSEVYVDVLSNFNKGLLPSEYFPEEDTPPKGKSLTNITDLAKNAGGWMKSAANLWNKSFYCRYGFARVYVDSTYITAKSMAFKENTHAFYYKVKSDDFDEQ